MAISVNNHLKKGKRVAVLDLDGHHGDGTQSLLEGKRNSFYCSIHQGRAFPGTGIKSQKNYLNIPLYSPVYEKDYFNALDKCIEKIEKFNPEILGVSLGFDTFRKDRLLDFKLNIDSYNKIGKKLGQQFQRVYAVLEGGYHDEIKNCVESFVSGINSVN